MTTLSVGQLEAGELEELLLRQYHSAAQLTKTTIGYPNSPDATALTVSYDKSAIVEIQAGPAFTEEALIAITDAINGTLLADCGYMVGQTILLAAVPVNGFFRYADEFQILPAPPDAPKPPFLVGDHPFVLQFRFRNSPDWQVRLSRRTRVARQIELMLGALTNRDIHGLSTMTGHLWVALPTEDLTDLKTAYCQEMYSAPGLKVELDDFITPTGLSPIVLRESTAYLRQHGIGAGDELDLPALVDKACKTFYALSAEDRRQFLTCCFWLRHSNRVHRLSRSAYFMALISAMEALMPPVPAGPECPTCHKRATKSLRVQFAEFIEQYAGATSEVKDRQALYSIRSALSHGGRLLRSDQLAWAVGLTGPGIQEWSDLSAAWSIARPAAVKWLMAQEASH